MQIRPALAATAILTAGVAFLLEQNKVRRYAGHGRIEGSGTVVVDDDVVVSVACVASVDCSADPHAAASSASTRAEIMSRVFMESPLSWRRPWATLALLLRRALVCRYEGDLATSREDHSCGTAPESHRTSLCRGQFDTVAADA